MRKKKNYRKVANTLVVVLVMVFAIAAVWNITAAQVQKSKIAELTDLATALSNADIFSKTLDYLSAEVSDIFGAAGSRFPNGIAVGTTTAVTTAGDLLVGVSDVNMEYATVTPATHTHFTINESIDFSATTTANPSHTGLASYTNRGSALLCDPPVLSISTALASFGTSCNVGTTTPTGDDSLTNTSTNSLLIVAIGTTTAWQFSPWDTYNEIKHPDIGFATTTEASYYAQTFNATGTPWVLDNGVTVVANCAIGGASRSESWSAGYGFTGVGSLKVECGIE